MSIGYYGSGLYGLGLYGEGELAEDRIGDYRVEIGFGGGIGGRFRLGYSTIGGTDIITTAWTEFFDGPYDDVTDYVAEGTQVAITRGWDQRLAALESGKVKLTIFNSSNPSMFDPNEPTSPLNDGTVDPGFVPMRPLRVRSVADGGGSIDAGLSYAFIRSASYDPETGRCVIQAEDLLLWMSRIKAPLIGTVAGVTSADAIGLLLDSFGWTDPAMRDLSATPALTGITFGSDGTKTLLQLMSEILEAEQGRIFVDGNGVFHFEDRYARDRRRTASYSFDAELTAVSSRASVDDIANSVTVTGADNIPATRQDLQSVRDYGQADAANITSNYLADSVSSGSLAALLLKRLKDPRPPQLATIDNQDASTLRAQLQIELQDLVTISGTDCYVERVEHTLNAGGVYHQTKLLVTEAPAETGFEIGVSTLESSDYIAA
jgi:hypothetical protein